MAKPKNTGVTVYTTSDYDAFTITASNRDVKSNPRLLNSLQEHGWIPQAPMIVVRRGSELLVKDGAHRLTFAQKLGIPVCYTIREENDFEPSEISNGKQWSAKDFVQSYSKRGNQDYQYLVRWAKEWEIPIGIAASILGGASGLHENLIAGNFKANNKEASGCVLQILSAISGHVSWSRNAFLIKAVIWLVRHTDMDAHRMVNKINAHPGYLKQQPNAISYVRMLEDVYNRQTSEKKALLVAVQNAMVNSKKH